MRMLDISENGFSGVLPSDYFAGWSALSSVNNLPLEEYSSTLYYHKSVALTNKGLKMELVGIGFTMYKTIDLSGNRLEGDIPESIGLLNQLIVLNMSNNAFTGRIPSSLANLTNLESLDLSQNRLSGKIHQSSGNSQNPSSAVLLSKNLRQKRRRRRSTKQEEDEEDETFSWIAAAVAYVPGVFCGLTIGHILSSYKPYWFVRIFHSFT
ncbi:unnamed protein product [Microthlaspi erraticum]|uniref:Leucine-rich repeat-containing N-terminal plant-type domain-containing protein n=1 Tax=Microthlaspi erraticum TaxID=1685480 RepID=A0A6D2ILG8_9BRAS|nr:unnamed protein product [Microthlaspi erraticum]